ncbi:OLC1v1027526C1 [Oldenlandia corymbosa var. corymbosa]|uniref:OLC1v1027526C1 n=1 Tax=Oldenlandia corymbosa var. corymbosa TaxID=529605 RepID=A0AAV1C9Y7_OLDCO|nr:OLC1v1027526C1 [Oldenlandia corymbosa var. corymbosa]
MADKDQRPTYPLAPANGYHRSDAEYGREEDSGDLRRKKRIRYFLYFVAFVIFQTGVIAIFTLTIMKVRTPKFRMESATFDSFSVGTSTNPTFDIRMNARVSIKNANFGKYKYDNTTMYFFYQGSPVGQADIYKSSVGWRTNKKFNAVVNLSSVNLPSTAKDQLGNDLTKRLVPLTSMADLKGKVALTFIFKKKKAIQMNCTMEIVVSSQQLSNIVCK